MIAGLLPAFREIAVLLDALIRLMWSFTQLLAIPFKVAAVTVGLVFSKASAAVGPVPVALTAAAALLLLGTAGVLLVVRALR